MILAVIIFGSIIFFLYSVFMQDPNPSMAIILAMFFQTIAWSVCLIALVLRSPSKTIDIRDAGIVFLFWSFMYLVYPSASWVVGLDGEMPMFWFFVSDQLGELVIWLHSLFIVSFTASYLALGMSRRSLEFRMSTVHLPGGWTILLFVMFPLLLTIGIRFIGTGQIMPSHSYGESWLELTQNVENSRSLGGTSYLMTQLTVKFFFYNLYLTGTGLGLILCRISPDTAKGKLAFIASLIFVTLSIHFNGGARSGAFVMLILALIIIAWVRPLGIKELLPILVAGLVIFEIMGIVRGLENTSISGRFLESLSSFLSDDSKKMGEFKLMFIKEAAGIDKLLSQGYDPWHLIYSLTSFVPSQINPLKLDYMVTSEFLGSILLGETAKLQGRGVGGAAVVDGFRFGGIMGVSLMGIIVGGTVGILEKWLFQIRKSCCIPPPINIIVYSCLTANLFLFIRGGLDSFVSFLIFYVFVPLAIVHLLANPDGKLRSPGKQASQTQYYGDQRHKVFRPSL